jgi:hypothetical protein
VDVLVAADSRPSGAPLDLHEGIATKPRNQGCARWPKSLRLASNAGGLLKGRCRATNLCRYCQALYVIETVEALTLDALQGSAPSIWVVLTAREHLTRPDLNAHLKEIRRSLQRHGWVFEWFAQVEFQRRGALHVNLLVKGVHGDDCERFREALVSAWCHRVDALPVAQWAEAVADPIAVTRYTSKMLAHGLKYEQSPPLGWKGHRTSHTRGYFGRPMWKVRAEAAASLRLKRAIWRAEQDGFTAVESQVVAELEVLRAEQLRWECVVLSVDNETGEVLRARPLRGGGVSVAMRIDKLAGSQVVEVDRSREYSDFLAGDRYGLTEAAA